MVCNITSLSFSCQRLHIAAKLTLSLQIRKLLCLTEISDWFATLFFLTSRVADPRGVDCPEMCLPYSALYCISWIPDSLMSEENCFPSAAQR